ncbi:Sphingomyelin phosphodiesterase [Frankliniella fusca]|uniref:Sphingomyelin phosphodiesterase n=1 Tax=Frankliniella fusca TaxID=407009 RepID=A0AAE1HUF8_9NEOP|nr:Sphingomyelin phosphodiesterase [Frankliniella fusca]
MERFVVMVAVSSLALTGCCSGGDTASHKPLRVNSFGQHTDDLARTTADLIDALSALEAARGGGGGGGAGAHGRERRSAEVAAAKAHLNRVMEDIRLPDRMTFFALESTGADARTTRTCRLCHAVGGAVIHAIRNQNKTGEALGELVVELCVRANVIAPHICRGMIMGNLDIVEYVVRNTETLDGPFACGTIMAECADGTPSIDWTLDKDMGVKPPAKIHNTMLDLVSTVVPLPLRAVGRSSPHERPLAISSQSNTPKAEPYRILQISDYHWDTTYNPEGTIHCGEPTCCRRNQGAAKRPEDRAGKWGNYRACDIPWQTVEEFIKHTQESYLSKDKVDLIYFTGDVIDHGVWETSRGTNVEILRSTFASMKQAFGDVRVLPIVGNHEPHPLNCFAPDTITDDALSSRWLYEVLADVWIKKTRWLPESTRETILRGGFYTLLVEPGFRVIALNNMYCYPMNWWVLYNPVDPSGQLAWLVDVLLEAEAAGEKVHILSHIPPGSADCLVAWSREFAKIVDRFSATIAAHFNGHTHVDDMVLFYDQYGRPNNVAFNGGSLTTYSDVNPNYKLYLVDGNADKATWNVIDAELWGFNLTLANENPDDRPKWYPIYTFRETFGVKSMHPVHLEEFIGSLAKDEQKLQKYYWSRMLDSDVSHSRGCDKWCAQSLICSSLKSVPHQDDHCQKFINKRK